MYDLVTYLYSIARVCSPSAAWTLNLVSLTGEGFDVFSTLYVGERPDTRPDRNMVVTADTVPIRDGETLRWGIRDPRPSTLTVRLKEGVVGPLDTSVRVSWKILRSDTGAVVFEQDLPFRNRLAASLGGAKKSSRTVVIDRTSAALMPVPEFVVALGVYRPLSGRSKEFGASRFRLKVEDRFDRTHPFVRWKGWAAGGPKQSAIHRTDIPGRCKMMDRAALRATFEYLDALTFPNAQITQKREGLRLLLLRRSGQAGPADLAT